MGSTQNDPAMAWQAAQRTCQQSPDESCLRARRKDACRMGIRLRYGRQHVRDKGIFQAAFGTTEREREREHRNEHNEKGSPALVPGLHIVHL